MASLPQKCLQFPSLWIFPSLFNRSACLYNLLSQEVNNEVSWQLFHWTSQSCAVIYYLLAQTKAQKLRGKLVLRNLLLVAINFEKKRANQLCFCFAMQVSKSTNLLHHLWFSPFFCYKPQKWEKQLWWAAVASIQQPEHCACMAGLCWLHLGCCPGYKGLHVMHP